MISFDIVKYLVFLIWSLFLFTLVRKPRQDRCQKPSLKNIRDCHSPRIHRKIHLRSWDHALLTANLKMKGVQLDMYIDKFLCLECIPHCLIGDKHQLLYHRDLDPGLGSQANCLTGDGCQQMQPICESRQRPDLQPVGFQSMPQQINSYQRHQ